MGDVMMMMMMRRFVERVLAIGMTNHPQKGRGCVHVTHYCMRKDLEKFRYGTPLTEINNAVDDGLPLLAPMALDPSDAMH